MTGTRLHRTLGLGLLLVLAIGATACSTQGPEIPLSSPQEQRGHSIKVYESPT